jgi:hypothetical protein
MEISRNAALTRLDGLETMTTVGAMELHANPKLVSLAGLAGLTKALFYFDIQDTLVLTRCEIDLLVRRFPNLGSGSIITGNGPDVPCASP